MTQKLIDNKLILRATLKIFSGAGILWLIYIFTAVFLAPQKTTKPLYTNLIYQL